MKLHQSDAPEALIDGAVEATEFGIEFNGALVQMLSAGLYTDVHKAIMRELSCNAWDAHIEAGNTDTPFEISLPGRFSPEVVFRDYGLGLSHEQAMNLYTRYGASTKTESNDATGALGLGSKSPLGYTQNYSVISYQGGKARTYGIFIHPKTGLPNCTASEPYETDQPDGLEIRIPTHGDDARQWIEAAQKVLQWFPMLPKIDLPGDEEIPQPKFKETFGSVTLFDEIPLGMGSYYSRCGVWAVKMGNVVYPLDLDKLTRENRNAISDENGLIEVEMGAVMFTPDRDSLNYTRATVEILNEKIAEFIRLYSQSFREDLAAVSSFTDWIALEYRIKTATNLIRGNRSLLNEHEEIGRFQRLVYIGFTEDQAKELIKRFNDGGELGEIREMVANWMNDEYRQFDWAWQNRAPGSGEVWDWTFASAFIKKDLGAVPNTKIWRYEVSHARGSYHNLVGELKTDIIDNWNHRTGFNKVEVVVNDTPRGALMAARRWIREKRPFGADRNDDALVIFVEKEEALDSALAVLDRYVVPHNLTKLSDIDLDDYRTTSYRSAAEKCAIMVKNNDFNSRRSNDKRAVWDRDNELDDIIDCADSKAKFVWVETRKYQPVNAEVVSNQEDLINFVADGSRYGIEGVVSVKKEHVELFENDADWIHIDDAIEAKTKDLINKTNASEVIGHRLFQKMNMTGINLFLFIEQHRQAINIADDVLATFKGHRPKKMNRYDMISDHASRLQLTVPGQDFDIEPLVERIKSLYNQVPALEHLIKEVNTFSAKHLVEPIIEIINKFTEVSK